MPKLSIVKVKLDREVNCYIVSCATTKEAVVIDPGQPVERIVEQAGSVTVKYILATHGHPGHVGGKDDHGRRDRHPLGGRQAVPALRRPLPARRR